MTAILDAWRLFQNRKDLMQNASFICIAAHYSLSNDTKFAKSHINSTASALLDSAAS